MLGRVASVEEILDLGGGNVAGRRLELLELHGMPSPCVLSIIGVLGYRSLIESAAISISRIETIQ